MSRRKPASSVPARGDSTDDGARSPALNAPFAGLRRQIRKLGEDAPRTPPGGSPAEPARLNTAGKGSAAAIAPRTPKAPPAALDPADVEAFHKTVGRVLPVRDGGRAELDAPRPAPVPRPRAPELEPEAPTRNGGTLRDPLQLAYEGVVPLRDSGRAELDSPRRHHERRADAARTAAPQRPDALILPADADAHDPATLFRTVVGETRPVDHRNRVELTPERPPPAPLKREEDERAALSETLAAPLTFEDRLDMGDEAAFLRPGLPRRVLTDLRRGRWVLQAQIDLHGLTRDEARAALAHFLHDMLSQGRRCIRVIHGKGHGSPGKVSILKQLSRGWLAQRAEILAFCQAGPHDGGGGALLVLLRAQNAAPR